MNPWKTLNIEATDDTRLIKKAYADKINQLTAEGNKKQIADVKLAYKLIQQLAQLKNNVYNTIYYPSSDEHDDLKNQYKKSEKTEDEASVVEEQEKINEVDLENIEDFSKSDRQSADDFIAQIIFVAYRKQIHRINLRHWRFIKSFKAVVCEGLQKQTAKKVFQLIAQMNLDAVSVNKPLVIPIQVIKQMDAIFDWHANLDEYNKTMSSEQIGIMFPKKRSVLSGNNFRARYGKDKKFVLVPLGISSRIGHFLLETIVYTVPVLIISIFTDWSPFELFKYSFLTVMGMKFVTEFFSNSTGASFEEGREHRISVVGENSILPNIFQVPARHIIIDLTLFPIYAWLFGYFDNENIVISSLTIDYSLWMLIFANLLVGHILSMVIYGKFLHDLVTGTYVVEDRIY